MAVKPLFNDDELLHKIAAGDQRAFRLFYDRYRPRVYTYALRILRDEDLAEDVLQEVFLKLWNMGGNAQTINQPEAWLRVATRNRSLNALKQKAAQLRREEAASLDWQEAHNDTEERVLINEANRVLQDAVEALPKQQKLVYQLCRQQGLDEATVAEQLSISPLTVKSHLVVAIRTLKRQMEAHAGIAMLLIALKIK